MLIVFRVPVLRKQRLQQPQSRMRQLEQHLQTTRIVATLRTMMLQAFEGITEFQFTTLHSALRFLCFNWSLNLDMLHYAAMAGISFHKMFACRAHKLRTGIQLHHQPSGVHRQGNLSQSIVSSSGSTCTRTH